MSAIARTGQRWGVGHIVDVLIGANTEMIRRCHHHELPTYGLLKELPKETVRGFTYQLIDQGLLSRTPGDRPTIFLNAESMEVLRSKRQVFLIRPRMVATPRSKNVEDSWEGVDKGLFEVLREVRKQVAHERSVPPFVVFNDVTLRDMARTRPASLESMRRIKGVGEKKLADLGDRFLEEITEYCIAKQISMDVGGTGQGANMVRAPRPNPTKEQAYRLFAEGRSIEEAMQVTSRARSTVGEYLVEFIETRRPATIEPWVKPQVVEQVRAAAMNSPEGRLMPIYEALDGRVTWEEIKVAIAFMKEE